jgi:hypothetical protein
MIQALPPRNIAGAAIQGFGARATIAALSDCRIEPRSASWSRFQRRRRRGSCVAEKMAPRPRAASSRVKVPAPPDGMRLATSGSSAISAVACRKKDDVITSASFMRRDSRTYCQPRRIAPRKRSPGSTEGGRCGRFQRQSTTAQASERTKFIANTYSLPAAAMMAPATSGPMMRERLTAMPLSASPPGSSGRGSSSGMIAAYTGQRMASPMPLVKTRKSSSPGVSPTVMETA